MRDFPFEILRPEQLRTIRGGTGPIPPEVQEMVVGTYASGPGTGGPNPKDGSGSYSIGTGGQQPGDCTGS